MIRAFIKSGIDLHRIAPDGISNWHDFIFPSPKEIELTSGIYVCSCWDVFFLQLNDEPGQGFGPDKSIFPRKYQHAFEIGPGKIGYLIMASIVGTGVMAYVNRIDGAIS